MKHLLRTKYAIPALLASLLLIFGFTTYKNRVFKGDEALDYCMAKLKESSGKIKEYTALPCDIAKEKTDWRCTDINGWTSGFWPGILWYAYEYTRDPVWKGKADSFSRALTPLAYKNAFNHDLGFTLYCSLGNGYRLTGDPSYKKILLASADTLATLFNPKVGTILSWPWMVKEKGWPHNTIIDNMMNLELLFWASKNGGSRRLADIALTHARITMKNHFRPDYSAYHVIIYDTVTGKKIKGVTHQGYSDASMWARGQSWAIYGFTMCYRESRRPEFLDFAQKVADVYLKRLPEDLVPYWDFDDPSMPNAPRDASAAAITASALLELSGFVKDKAKAKDYREKAAQMLVSLSSDKYRSGKTNDAFLLHSTGHKPGNNQVDASIIYADYYYFEALLRQKKLDEGKSIYSNL